MNDFYDIAIIGAGPSGLCAARRILMQDGAPSVLLIDKNGGLDKNIPCAEGVGCLGFKEVLTPKESWIRSVVDRAVFHSPDNTAITYVDSNKGWIINRALMQHDIAQECLELGATGYYKHVVTGVSIAAKNGNRTVTFSDGTKIVASLVIDCSGPLSTIGRLEGLAPKPQDLEAAYFAHIDNVDAEIDTVHLHVGSSIAPGGYAWSFPRNSKSMNVGIVLGKRSNKNYNIKKLMGSFIDTNFKNADIVAYFAGSIPCYTDRTAIAVSGLIKAGDSISTVNPISRAGISEAMKSGTMAADFALAMLGCDKNNDRKKLALEYEKKWYKKMGKSHKKLAKVKTALLEISDDEYNAGAHTLSAYQQNDITMAKIFTSCLGKFPKLVWALRYLM